MIRVTYRCGCEGTIKDSQTAGEPPRCVVHGDAIARVWTRPPSFVGMAHGPHVTTRVMDPASPMLATEGPLRLKTGTDHE